MGRGNPPKAGEGTPFAVVWSHQSVQRIIEIPRKDVSLKDLFFALQSVVKHISKVFHWKRVLSPKRFVFFYPSKKGPAKSKLWKLSRLRKPKNGQSTVPLAFEKSSISARGRGGPRGGSGTQPGLSKVSNISAFSLSLSLPPFSSDLITPFIFGKSEGPPDFDHSREIITSAWAFQKSSQKLVNLFYFLILPLTLLASKNGKKVSLLSQKFISFFCFGASAKNLRQKTKF